MNSLWYCRPWYWIVCKSTKYCNTEKFYRSNNCCGRTRVLQQYFNRNSLYSEHGSRHHSRVDFHESSYLSIQWCYYFFFCTVKPIVCQRQCFIAHIILPRCVSLLSSKDILNSISYCVQQQSSRSRVVCQGYYGSSKIMVIIIKTNYSGLHVMATGRNVTGKASRQNLPMVLHVTPPVWNSTS